MISTVDVRATHHRSKLTGAHDEELQFSTDPLVGCSHRMSPSDQYWTANRSTATCVVAEAKMQIRPASVATVAEFAELTPAT